MNKNEFLKKLKNQLENELSSHQIDEQIRYYDNYISSEIKNGKTEQEVLEELGDPNLIAKTIKQVLPSESNDNHSSDNTYNTHDEYNDNVHNDYKDNNDSFSNIFGNGRYKQFTGGSLSCFVIILIVFFVIYMILRLLGSLLYGGFYLVSYYPVFFFVLLLIIFLVNKGRSR